jgi:hypothetical protein
MCGGTGLIKALSTFLLPGPCASSARALVFRPRIPALNSLSCAKGHSVSASEVLAGRPDVR